MSKYNHTPGPWNMVVGKFSDIKGCCIADLGLSGKNKVYIACADYSCPELADPRDDAEFILHAVNNIDKVQKELSSVKEDTQKWDNANHREFSEMKEKKDKQIAVLREALVLAHEHMLLHISDYRSRSWNVREVIEQALSSTPSDMVCLTKEELNAPSRELWAAMADAFLLTHDKHHDVAIMAIYRAAVSQLLKERSTGDEVKES